jgi:hypothetical protein
VTDGVSVDRDDSPDPATERVRFRRHHAGPTRLVFARID